MNELFKLAEVLKEAYPQQSEYILKLAGKFQGQCSIYSISDDFEDYPNDLGYYEVLDQVEKIFKDSGIRIMMNEEFHEACIDDEGIVHGATVVSNSYDEDYEAPVLRFSVAVAQDKRQAGVARSLIESIIQQNPLHIIEAYVINPHMVPLLESLGFEGSWSEYDPIMRLFQ